MKTRKDFETGRIVDAKATPSVHLVFVYCYNEAVMRGVVARLDKMGIDNAPGAQPLTVSISGRFYDHGALARHINLWNYDNEFRASTGCMKADAAEDWWSRIGELDRQHILSLIRSGNGETAKALIRRVLGAGTVTATNVMIHACGIVSKECDGDWPETPEYDAVEYAHGEDCWNSLSDNVRKFVDIMLASGCSMETTQIGTYALAEIRESQRDEVYDAVKWRAKNSPEQCVVTMNAPEAYTVLAALRCWQHHLRSVGLGVSRWEHVATNNGELGKLINYEINALCRRVDDAAHSLEK